MNEIKYAKNKIFTDIADERERQTEKFGLQNHDIFLWLAILGEEVGECNNAAIEMKFTGSKTIQDLRGELVQVAAVAVQIIEWIDRTTLENEK
jgi:NTP pyrophosphatase (non-canonical NTP hydrolase)